MKNKIAKLVDIEKVEIFEEDLRSLGSGEILVKIKSSGICGSDLHFFRHGGLGSFKENLPMPLGHEPSGVVLDANQSKLFSFMDRVAIEPGASCACFCKWCRKGKRNLCSNGTFFGAAGHQGAFSEYVIVKESQLVKIPDNMSYDTASLLEPMGVALHTLQIMDINFLDTACIFGAGTVGLCILLALKRAGVTTIFSVDPLEYRCKFSEKFGSVGILYDESYHKKIKELTNNEGTSLVFDVAGTCDSVNGCLLVSATSGKMGIVGIPEEDFIDYNPHKMRMKEMKLYNIRRSNQTLDDCVNLYSNISLDDLVTHRFNLDDIQNAFDIASSYSDNVIKCVVADDV